MVTHADHCLLLAALQQVLQQVKARSRTCCPHHSFRWRFSSFRMRTSFKEGIRRDKEFNHIMINNDECQVRSALRWCLMFCTTHYSCYLSYSWSHHYLSCHLIHHHLFHQFLCSRLKQVIRLSAQHSVAQQAFSCHRIACRVSLSSHGNSSTSRLSSELSGLNEEDPGAQLTVRHSNHQECSFSSRSSSVQGVPQLSPSLSQGHWVSARWLSADCHDIISWRVNNQLSGSVNELIRSEKKRMYFIMSESEDSSFKKYRWLRSPLVSDDEAQEQSLTLFTSLSDTVNHYSTSKR